MPAVLIHAGVEVVKLPRKGDSQPAPGLVHWIPTRSVERIGPGAAPRLYQSIHSATTYMTACEKRSDGLVESYLECVQITCPVCQVAFAYWALTVREQD